MILPEELASVRFLRDLGEPHVKQIALEALLKEYPEGTVVFREGQDSPFIYFVLSGKVSLEVEEPGGKSARVYSAGPGELLGWSPVLGCRAMTATARAAARSRLAILGVDRILDLCEREPRFGSAFLRQIALVYRSVSVIHAAVWPAPSAIGRPSPRPQRVATEQPSDIPSLSQGKFLCDAVGTLQHA